MTIINSKSFKYKAALVAKTKNFADQKSYVKDTKTIIPLKYLSNFWRSLEMPSVNWIEDCILSSDGNSAKIEITDAKLHVPIVTLSTEDSVNLTKQLSDLKDLFIGTVIRESVQK